LFARPAKTVKRFSVRHPWILDEILAKINYAIANMDYLLAKIDHEGAG
jgi:hypothetical protein